MIFVNVRPLDGGELLIRWYTLTGWHSYYWSDVEGHADCSRCQSGKCIQRVTVTGPNTANHIAHNLARELN